MWLEPRGAVRARGLRLRAIGVLLSGAVALGVSAAPVAAAPPQGERPTAASDPRAPTVTALPVGTRWDYQLGGARRVPAGVGVVVRDRRERPAGRYDVCYVNAFQTQPDERGFWARRPGLLLRRPSGAVVVDGAWGEALLDLRSADERSRLAGIVGGWMRGCAAAGHEAVELDNLDSWSRSRGLLRPWQARAYARLLVTRAHRLGLAMAQKNWVELDGRRLGFDFAIAESCARWRECGRYVARWGRRVLAVEYGDAAFARACRRGGISVVRRDLALAPRGLRRWC